MNTYKNKLNPILEHINTYDGPMVPLALASLKLSDENKNVLDDTKTVLESIPEGNIIVELTYYPDTMPSIKSYYMMTNIEYEELKTLHMDLYIENFMDNEDLTKEKLDIYVINNLINIQIIKNFINQFGNPFDIIHFIYVKQTIQRQKQTNKMVETKGKINCLIDNYSDSNSDTILEPIIKPINKKSVINLDTETDIKNSSDSDSDSYIMSVADIIDTYNKTNKIDNEKIKKISSGKNKLNILNDAIINELLSK